MQEIKVTVIEFGDRKHFQMQFIDPITRKKKTRSTGIARTGLKKDRVEAERVAAKWEAELREGRYSDPSKITWAEFRRRYEDEVLSGLAKQTDVKSQIVFNLVERILNPTRLMDVTADRLSTFTSELRKQEFCKGKRQPARSETTIAGYLAHLRAALNWGASIGMIAKSPKFPIIKRTKGSTKMKGRAITAEEFDRMVEKVPKVVGESSAEAWIHFLRGMWLSGLRLTESLNLTWDDSSKLMVDMDGEYPLFNIPAEHQKNFKDQVLPIAPEFVEFLRETSCERRTGFVFHPTSRNGRQRVGRHVAIKIISAIGRAAGVKVHESPKTGKLKYASAHDLRRAFGERWAPRVMPTTLQLMMRHESIETTLRFYVGRNAQTAAKIIWQAYAALPSNTSGNTAPSAQEKSTHD